MTETKTETSVELDTNARQWLESYRTVRAQAEALTELLARCREQLEAAIGDADVATIDGEPVLRYPYVTSNRLDTKKLKEQRPDIYEEFIRPQMTRRFTVVDA